MTIAQLSAIFSFLFPMGWELETAFLLLWDFLCSLSLSSSTNCSWHMAQVGTRHNLMCLLNETTSQRCQWHLRHLSWMDLQMDWCCQKMFFSTKWLATISTGMQILLLCLVLTCLVRVFLLNGRQLNVQYTCLEFILNAVKHHRRMEVWLWLRFIYNYLYRKCFCYSNNHILSLE